jgi:hypothetical protein
MGEPTDEVVLEGGPADGAELTWATAGVPVGVASLRSAPAAGQPEWQSVTVGRVTYTDSGRRTAEGRRVFVPEGGG